MKFPDPPISTDFVGQGQPAPTDPWEKWFQAVSNQFTNGPQSIPGTHAKRLQLQAASISLGTTFFETDTGHVLIWSGTAWKQLI